MAYLNLGVKNSIIDSPFLLEKKNNVSLIILFKTRIQTTNTINIVRMIRNENANIKHGALFVNIGMILYKLYIYCQLTFQYMQGTLP